ncbi:MAG: hypothetical protein D6806_01940 [Deltaproteobacteria bacterium]|nr:MAG: hypothetical protein D6806_01940 [Deltaproteobacteria bacterium]
MRRKRGLAAFCATVVLVAAAMADVPLVDLADYLSAAARGMSAHEEVLEQLWPEAAEQKAASADGQYGLSLGRLMGDGRTFEHSDTVAREVGLPRDLAWAVLAAHSRGVIDARGWFRPAVDADGGPEGSGERCRKVARRVRALLEKLHDSKMAALALEIGAERAARAGAPGPLGEAGWLSVAQPVRLRARRWFCLVETLRKLYRARSVLQAAGKSKKGRDGVILAGSGGRKVYMPLEGRVAGKRGGCLHLEHGCGLWSILCGVRPAKLPHGIVQAGDVVGVSAGRAGWRLFLGPQPVSP